MRPFHRVFVGLLACLVGSPPLFVEAVDGPDHHNFLRRYAATYRFSLGRPTAIFLTPAGEKVLYLRSGPRDFVRSLYEIDASTGVERQLMSAEQLLAGKSEQLTAEELARRERMRLAARGIASYQLSRDGERVLAPLSGKLYVVERASGAVKQIPIGDTTPIDPQFSPDARQVAWVADGDIYVAAIDGEKPVRLTEGATETLTHGLAEFVAQEEMGRMHGLWWSPDSQRIVYQETDAAGVELLKIADPAHPERDPQPWRYPRAGTANAIVRLGIISAGGGPTQWIDWDREAFPYLANVRWEENAPLTIVVQDRSQQAVEVLEVDPSSGSTSRLLSETDEAWVNLDPSVPRWTANGKHFLWSSEQSGTARLELRKRNGSLERPLHPSKLVYRELVGVAESGEFAYFTASDDPIETHVYQVSLVSEQPPVRLTTESGVHSAVFDREGTTWVDTLMPRQGGVQQSIRHIPEAKTVLLPSRAEPPSLDPRLEWTEVTDDHIRAVLVRPLKTTKAKCPVIVHVYGGPHSQMVTAAAHRYLLDQWIADEGYIVVSLDGRGTPGRTRQWERAIHGNLIEVPLADQLRGLKALGAKFQELDLQRVGIFGWSFGGYFSAIATSRQPDVFHAGVAGAPVTDWRDYDTHYTERYLGMPDRDAANYNASSALTYAPELRRPLLLIHGTADDNVYFLHSLKLADALFRAGKEYEFLPLVGMTHMVTEPTGNEMLYGRIMDHFRCHLKPDK